MLRATIKSALAVSAATALSLGTAGTASAAEPTTSTAGGWTATGGGGTITGTTSYSGMMLIDRKFQAQGSLTSSGSHCVSLWTNYGFLPGLGGWKKALTHCGAGSTAFEQSGYVTISTVSTRGYLKVCRGETETDCGSHITYA